MRRLLDRTFAALASFGLAITVLAFLLLLTVIGTIEQTHQSLYEVQRRYFESAFVVHRVAGIPVPLPGVYLLLVVLFVNIVCGGIVRIRKDRTTWGVIVGHVGILAMLAGAAVEFTWSEKGHTTMAEGTVASEFVSYYDWEIALAETKETGPVTEYVIPGDAFLHLSAGNLAKFTSPTMPFDVVVHDVFANCEPQPASFVAHPPAVVDGFALMEKPRNKEAEADVAGAYVTVLPKTGGAPVEGVLWGRERYPMSVVVDGRRFTIEFTHRRYSLPFSIHLDEFRRQLHPGTDKPKSFESDVTKVQNGVPQKVKISMNAPLRQDGYTLYQSGFIEPSSGDGKWWSTFSVVKNPADRVPLWSCLVITAGLLMHFTRKLARHVKSQSGRRS